MDEALDEKLSVIAGAVFISPQQGAMQRCSPSVCVTMIPYECQMHDNTYTGNRKSIYQLFIPFKASGEGRVMLIHLEQQILLNHVVIVMFGPLKDVLLAHNV